MCKLSFNKIDTY